MKRQSPVGDGRRGELNAHVALSGGGVKRHASPMYASQKSPRRGLVPHVAARTLTRGLCISWEAWNVRSIACLSSLGSRIAGNNNETSTDYVFCAGERFSRREKLTRTTCQLRRDHPVMGRSLRCHNVIRLSVHQIQHSPRSLNV